MSALIEKSPAPSVDTKQRLVDATITAIYEHGISNITLARIAALAGLTAASVNFHFTSKEALLLATLRHVADEFEQAIATCLGETRADAGDALLAIVATNLDAKLTEPRKVAVWYAFMSESRARQDYQQICGDRDEAYFRTVVELCGRIARTAPAGAVMDATAVAYGLVGLIDELWQEILFTGNADDRSTPRARCVDYLASVFPWRFSRADAVGSDARAGADASTADDAGLVYTLPAWTYHNEELLALEKERIFMPSWQLVCHTSDLPSPGSYVTYQMMRERAFVVRDEDGTLRAFHNVCPHRAHAVVEGAVGQCKGQLVCPYHGWTFALDGSRSVLPSPETFRVHDARRFGLRSLDCETYLGWVFIRFRSGGPSVAAQFAPYHDEFAAYDTAAMFHVGDRYSDGGFWQEEVAMDWKNGIENYVEDYHFPTGHRGLAALMKSHYERDYGGTGVIRLSHEMRDEPSRNFSARLYRRLLPRYENLPEPARKRWTYYALFPNTFIDLFPEKMDFWQMIPTAAGRCILRGASYARPDDSRATRAVRYLSDRLNKRVQDEDNQLTASVQGGLESSGYRVGILSDKEVLVRSFQDWVRERLPVTRLFDAPARGTVARRNEEAC